MAGVDHQQPPGRRRVGDVEAVAVGVDGARIDQPELPAGHVLEPAGAAIEAAQSAAGLVEQPEHVLAVDRDMARRDQPAEAARGVAEHREGAGQRRERQRIVVLADLEVAALPLQPPFGAAAERHPQGIVRRHRRRRDEGGGAHAELPFLGVAHGDGDRVDADQRAGRDRHVLALRLLDRVERDHQLGHPLDPVEQGARGRPRRSGSARRTASRRRRGRRSADADRRAARPRPRW